MLKLTGNQAVILADPASYLQPKTIILYSSDLKRVQHAIDPISND
jgi:hypothetical protein